MPSEEVSSEQIEDIIRTASLAPVESERKVMILDEFHLLTAQGAARLLKTLEEPPASTMFVVLADQVDDELVTIASRCVRIEFGPIDDGAITAALVADGHPLDVATSAAAAASGNLDRARVLVTDPQGLVLVNTAPSPGMAQWIRLPQAQAAGAGKP